MSRPKIVYGDSPTVKFSEIKIGETFVCSNNLYLRIQHVQAAPDNKPDFANIVMTANAISLSDGGLKCFMYYDNVTPVDIEIKVR